MNADGSEVTRLTSNRFQEDNPAWSPNGEQLAFEGFFEGRYEIFVMQADGSNVRRLTDHQDEGDYSSPAWSPDGKTIAFAVTRRVRIKDTHISQIHGLEIRLMNSDGSGREEADQGATFRWLAGLVSGRYKDRLRLRDGWQRGDLCHGCRGEEPGAPDREQP